MARPARCVLGAVIVAAVCWMAVGVTPAAAGGRPRGFSSEAPAVVRVRSAAFGRSVPRGFVGLSFEFGYVFPYTGIDPAAVNPVLVRLVADLDPGGGFVMRVGGDSTDWTWWPIPGMRPPLSWAYGLSADWVAVVRALADATHGRLILGVNLEAGSTRIAAVEGRELLDGLGRKRVEAVEIGNEPESYSTRWYGWGKTAVPGRPGGYDFDAFLGEFDRFRRVLPAVPLAGPATGSLSWLAPLPRFVSVEPQVAEVTAHRYPLSNCEGNRRSPNYPTVPNLLSVRASRGVPGELASYVTLAHRYGRTFRVDEFNSVTCQGRAGVSNSAASALWALDTLFEMAALGVDAVNLHMWPIAVANQPFTFARSGGRWVGTVRPIYYGLLMFARAAPPGSRLLRVEVSGPADVRAWATLAPDHKLRIVVINASPNHTRTVIIHPPARAPATIQRLLAPSPYATNGVTIAGQSFGPATPTGVLSGPIRATVIPSTDHYQLTLTAGSAAMLITEPGSTPRSGGRR